MKQVMGERKRKMCERVTGRAYRVCYANGARDHYWAQCWFGNGETVTDADNVNYRTGEWMPAIREGQYVKQAS